MEFILGLLILIADIYAIYNILTSGASTAAKAIWTLLVVLLPVVGFVIWLVAGPRGSSAQV